MKLAYIFCVFLLSMPMALTAQLTAVRTTTVRFVADMSTVNEVPPVSGAQGNGTAEIVINLTRTTSMPDLDPQADEEDFLDDILGFGVPVGESGNSRFSEVTAAAVEFRGNANFGQAETVTGFHVHEGAAGQNGTIVVDPQFGQPQPVEAGASSITRSVTITDSGGLEVIRTILQSPRDFYVNLHTESHSSGFMRGQLALGEEFQRTRTDRLLSILEARTQIIMENVNRIARALSVVPVEDELAPPSNGDSSNGGNGGTQ
jgi:hypothetical protein